MVPVTATMVSGCAPNQSAAAQASACRGSSATITGTSDPARARSADPRAFGIGQDRGGALCQRGRDMNSPRVPRCREGPRTENRAAPPGCRRPDRSPRSARRALAVSPSAASVAVRSAMPPPCPPAQLRTSVTASAGSGSTIGPQPEQRADAADDLGRDRHGCPAGGAARLAARSSPPVRRASRSAHTSDREAGNMLAKVLITLSS